jgi:hypothetical protein
MVGGAVGGGAVRSSADMERDRKLGLVFEFLSLLLLRFFFFSKRLFAFVGVMFLKNIIFTRRCFGR